MTGVLLDTTFVIDLERERRRPAVTKGGAGPAQAFLQRHGTTPLYLPFTAVGELAAGESLADKDLWKTLLGYFRVIESTPQVCWQYGALYRYLKTNGLLIGGNDLWIAATALAHDLPLVTRNEKHFRRVPDLEVISYADRPD